MKFLVTMKDPDVMHDAIEDAVKDSLSGVQDREEREALAQVRAEKLRKLCSRWFEHGEYLTVEVDTEAGTCTVVCQDGAP